VNLFVFRGTAHKSAYSNICQNNMLATLENLLIFPVFFWFTRTKVVRVLPLLARQNFLGPPCFERVFFLDRERRTDFLFSRSMLLNVVLFYRLSIRLIELFWFVGPLKLLGALLHHWFTRDEIRSVSAKPQ